MSAEYSCSPPHPATMSATKTTRRASRLIGRECRRRSPSGTGEAVGCPDGKRRPCSPRTRGSPSGSDSTSSPASGSRSTRSSSTRRSFARSPARRTRRAPATSTSSTATSTSGARTSSTPTTTISAIRRRGSSSGSKTSAPTAARCSRSPATRSRRSSPTSTAAASRRARMRDVAEASLKLTDGALQLVDRRVPERGLGEHGLRRAGRRAALGARSRRPSGSTSPTRSRPGGSTSTKLERRAAALNERRFDALRYRGPGTDLTVGLHPDSIWQAALDESIGIKHVANMPTEEVFTTPDARRVDGTVRSTYPLQIHGTIVRGLEVRFEGGRAVEVRADEGEELMRTHVADRRRRGPARRGRARGRQLARRQDRPRLLRHALRRERLVAHRPRRRDPAGGRRAPRDLSPEQRHERGVNHSSIHTDFMIGSNELDVAGVTTDGEEVPILRARRLGPLAVGTADSNRRPPRPKRGALPG